MGWGSASRVMSRLEGPGIHAGSSVGAGVVLSLVLKASAKLLYCTFGVEMTCLAW